MQHTCCDQEIHSLFQFIRFSSPVGTSHHDSVCLGMLFQQLSGDTPDLQRELSCWREDKHTGAIPRLKFQAVQ